MKKKIMMLIFGLCLILPSIGLAAPDMKSNPNDCHYGKRDHFNHKNWEEMMKEREQKLYSWVDQYTPEKKDEWAKVLEERKELHKKWHSPEFKVKHEQWKKERMVKIQELQKQYDQGKITKEEFMKKAHGGKDFSHWKSFHDVEQAVKSKNDEKTAQLLNQLLEQNKQRNEMMKEIMSR
ncbi:MAG: hypothetical protein Q8934_07025 [Bacillota bacterium]|nr:hypothetical protein [Bacillota bacterium]